MGTVSDIKTGIASLVTTYLGADFRELSFGVDPAKNKFNGGLKGYSINPQEIEQVDGVTNFVTVDQVFEITLTETYGQTQTGDAAQRTAAATLFDRMQTLYGYVVRQKAAVAAVINVSGLRVARPEFLDSNVAVLKATVLIKYRTAF